jgi:hypothetical protein
VKNLLKSFTMLLLRRAPGVLLLLFFAFKPAIGQRSANQQQGIEIVFCLDLSGSTNGLIDNVRENIWGIVNMMKKLEPSRKIKIGVVGYSRPNFGKENAYIKTISRLSSDYDELTFALWQIRSAVEKGDQFVSNALEYTASNINWSKTSGTEKIIFLVGNGNVNTGSGDYRSVVKEISEVGIKIVPVYCMRTNKSNDINGWNLISNISGEELEVMWVVKRSPFVKAAPGTEKLPALIRELDRQTIPYTKAGNEEFNFIKACDNHAMALNSVVFEDRAYYRVSDTTLQKVKALDLVEMNIADTTQLEQMDLSGLEKNFKKLSLGELLQVIKDKQEKKKKIVSSIKILLPNARQEYINSIVTAPEFKTEETFDRIVMVKLNSLTAPKSSTINMK